MKPVTLNMTPVSQPDGSVVWEYIPGPDVVLEVEVGGFTIYRPKGSPDA